MNLFKKIFIPKREEKSLNAYESWVVQWFSRDGAFSGDLNKEFEVFLSKKEADYFANQLRESFKLIRHSSNAKVLVYKMDN